MWKEWLNTLLKSSQVREKATTTKQSCHNQHRARFYEQNCMWWMLFALAKQGTLYQWFSKLATLKQNAAVAYFSLHHFMTHWVHGKMFFVPRNSFFDDREEVALSCWTSKVWCISSARADWLIAVCHSKFTDTLFATTPYLFRTLIGFRDGV